MSDFGIFEADEAAQANPRLAARTAARKLEAAVDQVRAEYGRFLIAATGIDEFEDRWHLSKHDIRRSVEPLVFPNTGTMRRIKNALKADWKLAHPYKVALSHEEAGFGSMPEGDGPPKNQDLDETYHPSSGNLIPEGDFEGYKDSVDQDGPEKVDAHAFTPGGDSGSDRHARRLQAVTDPRGRDQSREWALEQLDDPEAQGLSDKELSHRLKKEFDSDPEYWNGKEAAALVADIYTDFAQSNGLRVASLDTLDAYAATGIAEADYRLLESMIVRTAEECEDDDSDDDDSDSDSEAPSASESDDSGDEDTEDADSDSGDDEGAEDDEDYDFGGDSDDDGDHDDADHHDGGDAGGQQFTVPEQAPELDPQLMGEIPADDTDGSAPVPPEVIDSLLGLPEGTIEQLLLEEVEQGGGYADEGPSAPGFGGEAGGDDFLGEAGGDNTQPPRMARRRVAAPDESEAALMDRQRRQQRDAIDTKFGPSRRPSIKDLTRRAQAGDPDAYAQLKSLWDERGWKASRRQMWAAEHNVMDLDDEGWLKARNPYTGNPEGQLSRGEPGDPDARWEKPRRRDLGHGVVVDEFVSPPQDTGPNKHHARWFWAADDQEQSGGEGGGEQADPAAQGGDPAAQGMDPAAMMGGGMMPPPGSQAVQPPAPPQPIEDQPAEDALLDTANQAIMQMIDRETQEYQQIIDPLSQALQAIQFAQQVEQAEHPMDVTPPEGTVNVDPSQAPGGAGNPMQQQASRRTANEDEVCESCYEPNTIGPDGSCFNCDWTSDDFMDAWEENGKNPEFVNSPYGQAMWKEIEGRADLPPGEGGDDLYHWLNRWQRKNPPREAKKRAVLKNAARLIAGRYKLSSTGERMLLEAMGRRNYEHVREALQLLPPEHMSRPEYLAAVKHIGEMFAAENPRFNKDVWASSVLTASRGRLPFDSPRRTAGETWVHTPTMDAFEFPGAGQVPRVDDNNDSNNLPVMNGADPHGKNVKQADILKKLRNWLNTQQQKGLNFGGDVAAEGFLNTRKKPLGPKATQMVHQEVGAEAHPPPNNPAPKAKSKPPKATNPVTKKGTWGEWEPTKEASFFTRKVPGWRWDDHLNGYISKEGRAFTCACGEKVAAPSYKTCGCGKVWNVYAIGDTHHLASDSAEMFIAREIPVRDGVIMANRKMAGAHPDEFYPEVPGYTNPGARRLQQILQDNRGNRPVNAIEGIPADADYYLEHGDPHAAWVLQKEKQHGKPLSQFTEDDWAIAGDPPSRKANRKMAGWQEDAARDAAAQDELRRKAFGRYSDDELTDWYNRVDDDEDIFPHLADELRDRGKLAKIASVADASHRDLLAMIDKLADWTKYDDEDPVAKGAALFARLAGEGMSYEDAMKHIDDVLAEGEGHSMHKYPGAEDDQDDDDDDDDEGTRSDAPTPEYDYIRNGDPKVYDPKADTFEGLLARTVRRLDLYADDVGGLTDWERSLDNPRYDDPFDGDWEDEFDDYDFVGDFGYRPGTHYGEPPSGDAATHHPGREAAILMADWTKYDDEVDPVVEAYGKSKIPSTKAPRIPRDWSRREPDGTWKGPAIPRKKK